MRKTVNTLERAMLVLVIAAAVLGWAAHQSVLFLDHYQAISIVLGILVFASGATVPVGALSRLRVLAPRLTVVVIAAGVTLPVLTFALSRLLPSTSLRDGVLAVGVAPAEVASVGITGIAGGEVGAAAALLVASTLLCVVAAGPILSVVAGHGVSSVHVLISLTLVVGLPLVAGLTLRHRMTLSDRASHAFQALAIVAVVVLVGLVSGQIHLSAAYGPLLGILVALIGASTVIGLLLGWRLAHSARIGVVLNVSMRDFAVASGIAAAAFGPAAAAPLGIYGVLVMVWGALLARVVNRRPRQRIDLPA
jgi:predicted Na+-dependent transporter